MDMINHFKKNIFLFLCLLSTKDSIAQSNINPDKLARWQHLDLQADSVYGISTDRAYRELLTGRKKETVLVAVIDSGIDTLHEDLTAILWRNEKEKGHDEDRNGYVYDKYGWNFLGNAPRKFADESHRFYLFYKAKCSKLEKVASKLPKDSDPDCVCWQRTKAEFQKDSIEAFKSNFRYWNTAAKEDSVLRKILRRDTYRSKDIVTLSKEGNTDQQFEFMPRVLSYDTNRTNQILLESFVQAKVELVDRYSNPLWRRATKDHYLNFNDKYYGSANVYAGGAHGTHVTGIIAAVRNNSIGVDGVADAVRVMELRVIPENGDEFDKDVALAIRYAVDNGAKVINMSFGKYFSPQQSWVEDAMKYAAKHDVLIVHGAGNDMLNIDSDSVSDYPSHRLRKGNLFPNIIGVGANGPDRKNLIASFSNYGKETVDVFAPGVDIKSTVVTKDDGSIKDSNYESWSGTSMAAPVVTGLAAILRSYYPKLSAVQVKQIIESSVTKIVGYVTRPGSKGVEQVPLSELCKTGGIVNAYEAIKLADQVTEKKKKR